MPRHLSDILTFAVLGFVGLRLVGGLRQARTSQGRMLVARIVRGVRWRHVWPVPLVLAGVVAVASVLLMIPGLSWGWWSALGGQGNPVFGSSTATSGSALAWVIPMVFIALLLPALPLFAYAEEQVFRRGAERWSTGRRTLRIVQFGAIHAVIGIPIGAALALSVGGAYFMSVYLRSFRATGDQRRATIESARAHAVYNSMIVVAVVVVVVVSSLG